jgi:CRP-like cAMP-binding protein
MAARRLHESYAQTVEPTTIVSIGREELKHLIKRNPEVAIRIIEAFARQTRRLDERLADMSLREVPARLANLFLQLIEDEEVVTGEGYKIPTNYSQEQLGTMIRAKRVAVSRAFRRLKESGAVELKGRNIYIKNLEALKLAASQQKAAS